MPGVSNIICRTAHSGELRKPRSIRNLTDNEHLENMFVSARKSLLATNINRIFSPDVRNLHKASDRFHLHVEQGQKWKLRNSSEI